MTNAATLSPYGELIDPTSVRIQRLLPGTIERVWAYLTDSQLRGQWLATGVMAPEPGGQVEFVWRNDELSGHKEERPADQPEERRMTCAILRFEAPRLLQISWGTMGSEVTFELEPKGAEVLLTLTHRRLPDRSNLLGVSSGWHAHLEMLIAVLNGRERPLFWKTIAALRTAYDQRLPA